MGTHDSMALTFVWDLQVLFSQPLFGDSLSAAERRQDERPQNTERQTLFIFLLLFLLTA